MAVRGWRKGGETWGAWKPFHNQRWSGSFVEQMLATEEVGVWVEGAGRGVRNGRHGHESSPARAMGITAADHRAKNRLHLAEGDFDADVGSGDRTVGAAGGG